MREHRTLDRSARACSLCSACPRGARRSRASCRPESDVARGRGALDPGGARRSRRRSASWARRCCRPSAAASLARSPREARRAGFSPEFVLAVIRVESGGDPFAVSPKGALGLMQLRPAHGAKPSRAEIGVRWNGPTTLFDPVRERAPRCRVSRAAAHALREPVDRARRLQLGSDAGLGDAPAQRADSCRLQPARVRGLPWTHGRCEGRRA